ncbi:MAG TPA: 2,3-bisphosphoglycerate-independent phosphoglycerate mutase [Candidatus Limnocylindria bacterium]|nr:2,3-bisphosphoglycerate-independent phosphoglycerate mutase [Candidatus Limnocylindria bacterium]
MRSFTCSSPPSARHAPHPDLRRPIGGSERRLLVLVVIDGWGYNPDAFGNAIAAARKPNWDGLWARWPHTTLAAAGEPVGLPTGQQGNSEVGHLNIGAGRIVYQDLTRIDLAIRDGSFFRTGVLLEAMGAARAARRALHLIGLVSPGGVHSSTGHLYALLRMARQIGVPAVHVHAITDGRDEPPTGGARYVADLAAEIQSIGIGRIASVSGRYYAMDRDRRWDRTERAYRTIVEGNGPTAADAVAFITDSYRQGVTDEFLIPTRIVPVAADPPPPMRDGDSVIFFNFRPDRARQLTHAIVDPTWDHFPRSSRMALAHFVTFTEYEKGLPAEVAFSDEPLAEVVAEVVSGAGLRQFHTAETEKYAHVTYFLNGGREQPFEGEDRLLVPSPKVATYDLQPAMSAAGVAQAVLDRIAQGTDAFIVVNFANADMVGHTGVFPATVTAVEVVDTQLGRIAEATLARGGVLVVTADHGNAELKIDRATGTALTAHTTSPVPMIIAGASGLRALRDGGKLGDVAPTMLPLVGLPVPAAMTGDNLAKVKPESTGSS